MSEVDIKRNHLKGSSKNDLKKKRSKGFTSKEDDRSSPFSFGGGGLVGGAFSCKCPDGGNLFIPLFLLSSSADNNDEVDDVVGIVDVVDVVGVMDVVDVVDDVRLGSRRLLQDGKLPRST